MGPAARRYLAGFSDSAEPVKRIVASGRAEDVFDLAVPITTGSENDFQASIAAGKYSGKFITVNSESEWFDGRALEDRGTSPDQYRAFILPGTPHVPDALCPGFFANQSTPSSWQPALRAHFLQGHDWVTRGDAPPTSTRLATTDGELVICAARSAHRCFTTGAPTAMVARLLLMYVIAATVIVGLLTTMARREARKGEPMVVV